MITSEKSIFDLSVYKILSLIFIAVSANAQHQFPHKNAHAHNDYENRRPLFDALKSGFISIEADVHLRDGELKVAHNRPTKTSKSLTELYLLPLDSILNVNHGSVYPGFPGTFYLMIDFKTNAVDTYARLRSELQKFPSLLCTRDKCPVKIFISGNRPLKSILDERDSGIALDGRPEDLDKNYTPEVMPVISDNFNKWSSWDGKSVPSANDLEKIRFLAERVHKEGKLLRLWSSPDNLMAWEKLLEVGVDLLNTDRLEEMHLFLKGKNL